MERFVFLIFILLFVFTGETFSQLDMSGRIACDKMDTAKKNDLLFRLESDIFFKNNEYFSEYEKGYTLPGFSIQPALVYYAGTRLRFTAGANMIRFFGDDGLFDVKPVISAQFRASEKFYVILGAIRGNIHHGLIEPVYDPDNQYLRPVENGVQFLFDTYRFKMDAWIDWEQFITWGDSVPEMFTAGFSGNVAITDKGSKVEFSLPVQVVASHQSGQISDHHADTYSMMNAVFGIKAGIRTGDGFIRKVWLDGYYLGFSQFSGSLDLGFDSGHAFYPVTGFDYKYGQFMAGYWYADDFYSLKGNSEFMSVSNYNDFYSKYRHVGTVKATFNRSFMDDQIKLNVCVNGYYDITAALFDYSYGLSLIYAPEFKIVNIKSK